MSYSILIEIQIKTQKQNLWISAGWAMLLFLAGAIGSLIWFKLDPTPDNKSLEFIKLGPIVITAAVSKFPIDRILECRERINHFRYVKYCVDNPDCLPPDEMQTIIKAVLDWIADGLKSPKKKD